MSEKAKSWGPAIFAAVLAVAQLFMSHTLSSLDARVGRLEDHMMGRAAAAAPSTAASAALSPSVSIFNGGLPQ